MSWLSTTITPARAATLTAVLAIASLATCSRKPSPPAPNESASSVAITPHTSVLQWAPSEPVALVHTRDGVLARAVESGRSRRLWTGTATWVTHDDALDLLWIQTNEALDVFDLRAGVDDVVAIARGLPAGVPISVTRTTEGGSHASASPVECDSGRSLTLEWKEQPRLRYLDAQSTGWKEPIGAALVGGPWLRAQLARAPGATRTARRGFPIDASLPAVRFAERRSKCAADSCGKPIPFDGQGIEIVVTSFEQGDCQHFGCHLFDPAKKTFATPPMAPVWGELDKITPGSCGPYRFDRSGKRFLIETSLCVVGGKCEDLGGAAVGWIHGGVDVGTSG